MNFHTFTRKAHYLFCSASGYMYKCPVFCDAYPVKSAFGVTVFVTVLHFTTLSLPLVSQSV